jgi:hypothetical protein
VLCGNMGAMLRLGCNDGSVGHYMVLGVLEYRHRAFVQSEVTAAGGVLRTWQNAHCMTFHDEPLFVAICSILYTN